jgi:hypothetical protein
MLHSGELEIPLSPGSIERQRFVGKLKAPMERLLDHLRIPKYFYL